MNRKWLVLVTIIILAAATRLWCAAPLDTVYDVEAIDVSNPIGTVDSGATTTPIGVVYNLGTTDAGFWTQMRIFSPQDSAQTLYVDQESTFLHPGGNANVVFADWWAMTRGSLVVKCSTMYNLDQNHSNDAFSTTVNVRVIDAAAGRIEWPKGEDVGPGVNQAIASVRNDGTPACSIPFTFEIFDSAGVLRYTDELQPTLLPETESLCHFPNWFARPGRYTVRITTALPYDVNPANDTASVTFRVTDSLRDAGCADIERPKPVEESLQFSPKALIRNYGDATETIPACLRINDLGTDTTVYFDTATICVPPESAAEAVFTEWTVPAASNWYVVLGNTNLDGDQNWTDDTARMSFIVTPTGILEQGLDDQRAARLDVAPVPSSGRVALRLTSPDELLPVNATVAVCAVNGAEIKRVSISQVRNGVPFPLDLAALPNGVYLLRVSTPHGTLSRTLVLVH
jgi:prepilin-type processing-associated H-X9-DG protein